MSDTVAGFSTYRAALPQASSVAISNANGNGEKSRDNASAFNCKFQDVKEIQQDGEILIVTRTENQYTREHGRNTQGSKGRFGEYSLILRRIIDLNSPAKPHLQLEIQSDTLRSEFRRLSQKITSISLNHDPIIIPAPYKELYHGRELIQDAAQGAPTHELRQELQLLVDFLENYMSDTIERVTAFKESGTIDFESLWSLFTPGKHVIIQNTSATTSPIEWCAVLKSYEAEGKQWNITVTHTGFNGRTFGGVDTTFTFPRFTGTIDITQLPVYPIQFRKHEEQLKMAAVARGTEYEKYCIASSKLSTPPVGTPMLYRGPFWTERYNRDDERRGCRMHDSPSNTIAGRVIVDVEGFLSRSPAFRDTLLPEAGDPASNDSDDDSLESFPLFWRKLHRSTTADSGAYPTSHLFTKPLSSEQHLTCPPFVAVFSFTTRMWGLVLIDELQEIDWNTEVFEMLQLDNNIKSTLRDVVHGHSGGSLDFDDFIQGKGRGLVCLLHGPPGCGKTMTAECIAESLRKPLYSVGGGELGTDASSIQRALEKAFDMVSRWDAIFLLDEADTFLAERRGDSIERNALISVFLRLLEYQSGIIFLTTNRWLDIDEAFRSRIHITIAYSPLAVKQRASIWRNLAQEKCQCNLPDEQALALGRLSVDGRVIKNVLRLASLLSKKRGDGTCVYFTDIVAVLPFAIGATHSGEGPRVEKGTNSDVSEGSNAPMTLDLFMAKFGNGNIPRHQVD